MNNQELFIKYLDKQLHISKVKKFDSRLMEDLKFKNEFLEFRNKYDYSKKNISVDERYFETLIPNVKTRLDQSPRQIFWNLSYSLPILIVIIILVINNPFNQNSNLNSDFQEIFEDLSEDDQLAYDLFDNALSLEEQYLDEKGLVLEYYNDDFDFDESLFEYLKENINTDEINNNLVEELSEEEFSTLHQELIVKKYYR